MFRLFLLCICIAASLWCSRQIAGTNDETMGGIKAMVHYADGSAVPGASVKVFAVYDTQIAYITTTDTGGRYEINQLDVGVYNIWIEKDTLVAVRDSILIRGTDNNVSDDTVRSAGSVTAVVGVQPNDDPRSVYVRILGSDRHSGVDSHGRFTIGRLPGGDYELALIPTLPSYTPTFYTISAESGLDDTLNDTLWVIFTGIPVVRNLNATWDSVNSTVRLVWSPVDYRNLQDYVIYRDDGDVLMLSELPFAATRDTTFNDSEGVSGSTSGPIVNRLKYRVAVRNNTNEIGSTYQYFFIEIVAPRVIMTIRSSMFFRGEPLATNTIATGDTVTIKGKIINAHPWIDSIRCLDPELKPGVVLTADKNHCYDTLSFNYCWNTAGIKRLYWVIYDAWGNGGSTPQTDSIVVDVVDHSRTVP